jgi:hypothetical protein
MGKRFFNGFFHHRCRIHNLNLEEEQ